VWGSGVFGNHKKGRGCIRSLWWSFPRKGVPECRAVVEVALVFARRAFRSERVEQGPVESGGRSFFTYFTRWVFGSRVKVGPIRNRKTR
jgi:hypothetical protein